MAISRNTYKGAALFGISSVALTGGIVPLATAQDDTPADDFTTSDTSGTPSEIVVEGPAPIEGEETEVADEDKIDILGILKETANAISGTHQPAPADGPVMVEQGVDVLDTVDPAVGRADLSVDELFSQGYVVSNPDTGAYYTDSLGVVIDPTSQGHGLDVVTGWEYFDQSDGRATNPIGIFLHDSHDSTTGHWLTSDEAVVDSTMTTVSCGLFGDMSTASSDVTERCDAWGGDFKQSYVVKPIAVNRDTVTLTHTGNVQPDKAGGHLNAQGTNRLAPGVSRLTFSLQDNLPAIDTMQVQYTVEGATDTVEAVRDGDHFTADITVPGSGTFQTLNLSVLSAPGNALADPVDYTVDIIPSNYTLSSALVADSNQVRENNVYKRDDNTWVANLAPHNTYVYAQFAGDPSESVQLWNRVTDTLVDPDSGQGTGQLLTFPIIERGSYLFIVTDSAGVKYYFDFNGQPVSDINQGQASVVQFIDGTNAIDSTLTPTAGNNVYVNPNTSTKYLSVEQAEQTVVTSSFTDFVDTVAKVRLIKQDGSTEDVEPSAVGYEEQGDSSTRVFRMTLDLSSYGNEGQSGDNNSEDIQGVALVDKFGQVSNESTLAFSDYVVDNDQPHAGNFNFIKGLATNSTGPHTFTFKVHDDHSGIKEVVAILDNNRLPITPDEEGNVSFTVGSHGAHSLHFEVIDNVGYVQDVPLNWFKKLLYDPNDDNNFFIDNSAPKFTGIDPINGSMSRNWYSNDGRVYTDKPYAGIIRYSDDKIKSITVDHTDLEGTVTSKPVDTDNPVYNFSQSGSYIITLVDTAGNETVVESPAIISELSGTEYEESVLVVDREAPTLDSRSSSNTNTYPGYSNESITVSGNLSDLESGLATIKVYRDEALVYTKSVAEPTDDFSYTIENTGRWTFEFIDRVGNSRKLSYWDIAGHPELENHVLVIDQSAPTYNDTSITGGTIYSDRAVSQAQITAAFTLHDTSGLDKVEVYDGDNLERTVNMEGGTKFSTILRNAGEYHFVAYDRAGNSTRIELSDLVDGLNSNFFYVDVAAPTSAQLKSSVPVGLNDNIHNAPFTLSGIVEDDMGLVNLRVYKDDELVETLPIGRMNGEYVTGYEFEYLVEESGVYRFEISDLAGNNTVIHVSEFEGVQDNNNQIWIDTVAPTYHKVENTPYLTGVVKNYDGKWVSSAEPQVNIVVEDEFKLESATLFRHTDSEDELIHSFYPENGENSITIAHTLRASGEYFIQVKDVAGNITIIFPETLTEGSDSNEIIVDTVAPVVTFPESLTNLPTLESNPDLGWVLEPFEEDVFVTVSDNLPLDKSQITATFGDTVLEKTPSADGTSWVITVPRELFVQGTRKDLNVTVTDQAMTTSTDSLDIYTYTDDIPVEFTREADLADYPWAAYTSHPFSVEVSTDADIIGISRLETDDPDVGVLGVTGLTFRDDAKGNVRVYDSFNREQTFDLGHVLGVKADNLIIDNTAPEITHAISENDKWYAQASQVESGIQVSDDGGLKSASVVVNDSTVDKRNYENKRTQSDSFDINWDSVVTSDGLYTVEILVEDLAGNTHRDSFTFNVDTTAPTVRMFEINSPLKNFGNGIDGSDSRYGFFVRDTPSVRIQVEDSEPSSGLDSVTVELTDSNGSKVQTIEEAVSVGFADISLPAGFKGFISATVRDNVGNTSEPNQPDGIISGDSNTRINNSDLKITLPETPYKDENGIPLYPGSVKADLDVSASHAGIETVEYGVNESTAASASVSAEGYVSGSFTATRSEKNLVTDGSASYTHSEQINNAKLWLKATDNTEYESETSATFSVDTHKPVVTVDYDWTAENGIHNRDRVATIRVVERNFDPNKVDIQGTSGNLGAWSRSGEDVWTANMTFSEDKDYEFTVTVTDRSGQVSETVSNPKFTIDKTAPVVSVGWNGASPSNGNYYPQPRVATVEVIDAHFEPSRVELSGDGSLSGWSSNGNTHTATVSWAGDGQHSFGISVTDAGGNKSNEVIAEPFIVDTHNPEIEILGVTQGTAYYETPNISVKYSDQHPNTSAFTASLVGRKGNVFELPVVWDGNNANVLVQEIPDKPEADDLYTLTVSGSDLAGNKSEESVQFIVNRYGSDVTVQGTDYSGKYVQKADNIVLQEVSVERLDLSKLKINVTKDGEPYDLPDGAVKIDEREEPNLGWVYTYRVNEDAFEEDGAYTVKVVSRTVGGREDISRLSYSFVVDSTSPTIVVSNIEEGGRYKTDAREVTLTTRDRTQTTLDVMLNGEKVEAYNKGDGSFRLVIPESTTPYTLTAKSVDLAGNVGEKVVEDFYINSSWWRQFLVSWQGKLAIVGFLILSLLGLGFLVTKRRRGSDDKTSTEGSDSVDS